MFEYVGAERKIEKINERSAAVDHIRNGQKCPENQDQGWEELKGRVYCPSPIELTMKNGEAQCQMEKCRRMDALVDRTPKVFKGDFSTLAESFACVGWKTGQEEEKQVKAEIGVCITYTVNVCICVCEECYPTSEWIDQHRNTHTHTVWWPRKRKIGEKNKENQDKVCQQRREDKQSQQSRLITKNTRR